MDTPAYSRHRLVMPTYSWFLFVEAALQQTTTVIPSSSSSSLSSTEILAPTASDDSKCFCLHTMESLDDQSSYKELNSVRKVKNHRSYNIDASSISGDNRHGDSFNFCHPSVLLTITEVKAGNNMIVDVTLWLLLCLTQYFTKYVSHLFRRKSDKLREDVTAEKRNRRAIQKRFGTSFARTLALLFSFSCCIQMSDSVACPSGYTSNNGDSSCSHMTPLYYMVSTTTAPRVGVYKDTLYLPRDFRVQFDLYSSFVNLTTWGTIFRFSLDYITSNMASSGSYDVKKGNRMPVVAIGPNGGLLFGYDFVGQTSPSYFEPKYEDRLRSNTWYTVSVDIRDAWATANVVLSSSGLPISTVYPRSTKIAPNRGAVSMVNFWFGDNVFADVSSYVSVKNFYVCDYNSACGCRGGQPSASVDSVRSLNCTSCAAGTYSTGVVSSCLKCPANYYSLSGATSCTPCPINSYSSIGSSACNCNAGYIKSGDGASMFCVAFQKIRSYSQPTSVGSGLLLSQNLSLPSSYVVKLDVFADGILNPTASSLFNLFSLVGAPNNTLANIVELNLSPDMYPMMTMKGFWCGDVLPSWCSSYSTVNNLTSNTIPLPYQKWTTVTFSIYGSSSFISFSDSNGKVFWSTQQPLSNALSSDKQRMSWSGVSAYVGLSQTGTYGSPSSFLVRNFYICADLVTCNSLPCAEGTYGPVSRMYPVCQPCPANSYSPADSPTCLCNPGFSSMGSGQNLTCTPIPSYSPTSSPTKRAPSSLPTPNPTKPYASPTITNTPSRVPSYAPGSRTPAPTFVTKFCPVNAFWDISEGCVCKTGYYLALSGQVSSCLICPLHSVYDSTTRTCLCVAGYSSVNVGGVLSCKQNCPENSYSYLGSCVCSLGYIQIGSGSYMSCTKSFASYLVNTPTQVRSSFLIGGISALSPVFYFTLDVLILNSGTSCGDGNVIHLTTASSQSTMDGSSIPSINYNSCTKVFSLRLMGLSSPYSPRLLSTNAVSSSAWITLSITVGSDGRVVFSGSDTLSKVPAFDAVSISGTPSSQTYYNVQVYMGDPWTPPAPVLVRNIAVCADRKSCMCPAGTYGPLSTCTICPAYSSSSAGSLSCMCNKGFISSGFADTLTCTPFQGATQSTAIISASNRILSLDTLLPSFVISFDLLPLALTSGTANILTLTRGEKTGPGSAIPKISFVDGTLQLVVGYYSKYGYQSLVADKALALNKWAKILIIGKGNTLTLTARNPKTYTQLISPIQVSLPTPLESYPHVKVYASDPWSIPSSSTVRGLIICNDVYACQCPAGTYGFQPSCKPCPQNSESSAGAFTCTCSAGFKLDSGYGPTLSCSPSVNPLMSLYVGNDYLYTQKWNESQLGGELSPMPPSYFVSFDVRTSSSADIISSPSYTLLQLNASSSDVKFQSVNGALSISAGQFSYTSPIPFPLFEWVTITLEVLVGRNTLSAWSYPSLINRYSRNAQGVLVDSVGHNQVSSNYNGGEPLQSAPWNSTYVNSLTLEAWVSIEEWSSGNDMAKIFQFGRGGATNADSISVGTTMIDTDKVVRFQYNPLSGGGLTVDTVVTSSYFHILVTVSVGDFVRIYVNGTLATQSSAPLPSIPTTNLFFIAESFVDSDPPFLGVINELRIWKGSFGSAAAAMSFSAGPTSIDFSVPPTLIFNPVVFNTSFEYSPTSLVLMSGDIHAPHDSIVRNLVVCTDAVSCTCNSVNQYFDINQRSCRECPLHSYPAGAGFGCICTPDSQQYIQQMVYCKVAEASISRPL